MKKLIFALATCAVINAAPALAERAGNDEGRALSAPVIKLAPKTIDPTKSDTEERREKSAGGILGQQGGGTGGASKNPNIAAEGFKKDLEKKKWIKQSQEAREESKRSEAGMGTMKDQAKSMTKPDEKTSESMKATMEKKKKIAAVQKSCKKECYPELFNGKEDKGNDWMPDGYDPFGGLPKPVTPKNIFGKSAEEKAAEEEVKKKQEYLSSLPKAERQKICYQECLARSK